MTEQERLELQRLLLVRRARKWRRKKREAKAQHALLVAEEVSESTYRGKVERLQEVLAGFRERDRQWRVREQQAAERWQEAYERLK